MEGPGYTVDPYKEEGGECDDFISHIFEPYTGKGGLFSTWRERHIFLAGVVAGLKAGTLSNIPQCPPLWQDEVQYFDSAATFFNVLKSNWPGFVGGFIGVVGYLKLNNIV